MSEPERRDNQDGFYYANGDKECGQFPFAAVMDAFYAEAERRPEDAVVDHLNRSMTSVLSEAGTYVQWTRHNKAEIIKRQILMGLFEGWGLTDFPRGFLIEEAEMEFKFKARVKSTQPLEDQARQSIEKEMWRTGTTSDQIDTDAAIKYLVEGLEGPSTLTGRET